MAENNFEPLKKFQVILYRAIRGEFSLEWPLPASVSAWWRAEKLFSVVLILSRGKIEVLKNRNHRGIIDAFLVVATGFGVFQMDQNIKFLLGAEFTYQNIASIRITIEQIIPTCISPFVHVPGGIDM